MTKKSGLTLGKYTHLHRGHQQVIETALTEMEEVCVIVYDSREVTSIPLDVRSNWITTICPDVRLIKARIGHVEVGYTKTVMKSHGDYFLNDLRIKGIAHLYSSIFPVSEHFFPVFPGKRNRDKG
jgi:HTH-type transcriptional repressor of NAD biosynthesis genes